MSEAQALFSGKRIGCKLGDGVAGAQRFGLLQHGAGRPEQPLTGRRGQHTRMAAPR